MHFGDIGRILEPLLLVLLNPTSARVAIHYSWRYSNGANFRGIIAADNKKIDINIRQKDILENKAVNGDIPFFCNIYFIFSFFKKMKTNLQINNNKKTKW